MDFRLVLTKVFLLLEPLVTLFALEWLLKLFEKSSFALLRRVDYRVLVINLDHDNRTHTFSFIYFK
jgi:hypothetical protein